MMMRITTNPSPSDTDESHSIFLSLLKKTSITEEKKSRPQPQEMKKENVHWRYKSSAY